jgi:hypothetical protein
MGSGLASPVKDKGVVFVREPKEESYGTVAVFMASSPDGESWSRDCVGDSKAQNDQAATFAWDTAVGELLSAYPMLRVGLK